MQQESVLKALSFSGIKIPLLHLFTSSTKILQETRSWEMLCQQFPQLISSFHPFFPLLIQYIDDHGECVHGYKRLKLWSVGGDDPLQVMSLVGFIFRIGGKSVLNLHLYNTESTPNKNCYIEPSLTSLGVSLKTPIHDHNCLCLSHVACIDEALQATESFFELSSEGLIKISTLERTPATANLDDGSSPYIHQMEVRLR